MSSLGITVTRGAVHAVLVRRARVVWRDSIAADDSIAASVMVDELLRRCPLRQRWIRRRPYVVLALRAPFAQVKRVEGLPPIRNVKTLTNIVRQNSTAFFLHRTSGLNVGDIELRAGGDVWAAAFDAGIVDQLAAVLRRHRVQARMIVPVVAATSAFLRGSVTGHAADTSLAEIGPDFVDAYAAAVAKPMMKLSWRLPPEPGRVKRVDTLRVVAAAALFVVASGGAVLAPGLRARHDAALATAQLDRTREQAGEAARVQSELSRAGLQLDRIEAFEESRGQVTRLVGAIAQAVPESTALVDLHVDSLEGSFVAISPHASDVLSELVGIDGIVSPTLAGSVTRETQDGARLERATVRFRRRKVERQGAPTPPSRSRTAATAGGPR